MASRDLKDSEIEKGLTGTTIAMDGIAVIVNNDSPVEELSSDSVKGDVYKRQVQYLYSHILIIIVIEKFTNTN